MSENGSVGNKQPVVSVCYVSKVSMLRVYNNNNVCIYCHESTGATSLKQASDQSFHLKCRTSFFLRGQSFSCGTSSDDLGSRIFVPKQNSNVPQSHRRHTRAAQYISLHRRHNIPVFNRHSEVHATAVSELTRRMSQSVFCLIQKKGKGSCSSTTD